VGLAAQEPQVLDDDVPPGDLLGRQQREALAQIDLVIFVEGRKRVDTCAVRIGRAPAENGEEAAPVLLQAQNRLSAGTDASVWLGGGAASTIAVAALAVHRGKDDYCPPASLTPQPPPELFGKHGERQLQSRQSVNAFTRVSPAKAALIASGQAEKFSSGPFISKQASTRLQVQLAAHLANSAAHFFTLHAVQAPASPPNGNEASQLVGMPLSTPEPELLPNRINVDTGAALVPESGDGQGVRSTPGRPSPRSPAAGGLDRHSILQEQPRSSYRQ
jgi:hypothetical protein